MFHTNANPYKVNTIYNPRGLYMNYWASSPNNGVHVDHLYTMVKFVAIPPSTEPDKASTTAKLSGNTNK